MRLGYDLTYYFNTTFPGRDTKRMQYVLPAGSFVALANIAGNVSGQALTDLQTSIETTKAKLESNDPNQIGSLTREDLLGDMFQAGTLGYYAQYIALSYLSGLQQKAYHYLAGGVGSVGYEPNVSTFFGLPRAITPGGVALNIPIINVVGADSTDATKRRDFLLQIGILSSALEHAVPESMHTDTNTGTSPPDGFSAVKAIVKAKAAGQRIYHLTSANRNITLPNIHHDSATMGEISSALSVGKDVITHSNSVGVQGYSGAGYIILDPSTGEGAYKIAGGQNGGFAIFIVTFAFFLAILLPLLAATLSGVLILAGLSVLNILAFSSAITNALDNDALSDEQKESFIIFNAFLSIAASFIAGKELKYAAEAAAGADVDLLNMSAVFLLDIANAFTTGLFLMIERLFSSA
jgi:hypothetical protein